MSLRLGLLMLTLGLAAGCGKNAPEAAPAAPKSPGKPGVSIEESAAPPPAQAAPEAPPVVEADAAPPPPSGGASLNAEARKQRNLAWLKILKTGSAEQKQKVQDQLTHLSSEELTEITELYEKQEKLR